MRFLAICRTAETQLATEGCQPRAHGACARRSRARLTVTDGPFIETKEVVGGVALIQTNSKESNGPSGCKHLDQLAT